MKTCRFVFDINSEERRKQQKVHDDAVRLKNELESRMWSKVADGVYVKERNSYSNITDPKERLAKADEVHRKFVRIFNYGVLNTLTFDF